MQSPRTPTSWIDEFLNLWNSTRKYVAEEYAAKSDGDPSIDWLMDLIRNGPLPPSWSASADQIRQFEYMFSNMPGYGDWVKARDNLNFMADYLKNYGLTWADMLYPSLNRGSGSGWGILNFTSRNLEKFYKNL